MEENRESQPSDDVSDEDKEGKELLPLNPTTSMKLSKSSHAQKAKILNQMTVRIYNKNVWPHNSHNNKVSSGGPNSASR